MRALFQRHGHDLATLLLRLAAGGFMAIAHGWPKLMSFAEKKDSFMALFGLPSPLSLALCIFGELVCGVLLLLGLGTRFAAVPYAITMLVAAFVAHSDSPFGKGEHALLFATMGLALLFLGPGRFSVDGVLGRDR